eukprot:1455936-Amphidinium_carterae.1
MHTKVPHIQNTGWLQLQALMIWGGIWSHVQAIASILSSSSGTASFVAAPQARDPPKRSTGMLSKESTRLFEG